MNSTTISMYANKSGNKTSREILAARKYNLTSREVLSVQKHNKDFPIQIERLFMTIVKYSGCASCGSVHPSYFGTFGNTNVSDLTKFPFRIIYYNTNYNTKQEGIGMLMRVKSYPSNYCDCFYRLQQ